MGSVALDTEKAKRRFGGASPFLFLRAIEIEGILSNLTACSQLTVGGGEKKNLEGHPEKGTLAEIPFRVTLIAPLRLSM